MRMPWRGRSVIERFGDDGMAGDEAKLESLRQRADYDGGLEHRETLADAAAGTISKREIGAGGKAIRQTFEPSLGTESDPDRRNSADRGA